MYLDVLSSIHTESEESELPRLASDQAPVFFQGVATTVVCKLTLDYKRTDVDWHVFQTDRHPQVSGMLA